MTKYLFKEGFKREFNDTIAVVYDITNEKTAVKIRKDIKAYPIDTNRSYLILTGKNIYRIDDGEIALDNF